MRSVRTVRARSRGVAAVLLRAVRAAAPRTGVGGHRRGRPRRAHHHAPRARPRQPGVHRERPAHARRRARDRARALLDHRLQRLGELAAGAALGGHQRLAPGGRARAQRQPDQRAGAARGAARARRHVQFDVGLGDHRRDDRHAPGRARRGRDRRCAAAPARRLLDRGDDQGSRGRLPRPARPAPASDRRVGVRPRASRRRRGRSEREPLLRCERVVRVRHHRRQVPARRRAGRARHARRGRPRESHGRAGRAGARSACSSTSTSRARTRA